MWKIPIQAEYAFAIGDALIEEVGPSHRGDKRELEPVRAELERHGLHEYTVEELASFRKIAFAFPAERRYDGVHKSPRLGWKCYEAARDPDMLDASVHEFNKRGEKIDPRKMREYVKAMRELERFAKANGIDRA